MLLSLKLQYFYSALERLHICFQFYDFTVLLQAWLTALDLLLHVEVPIEHSCALSPNLEQLSFISKFSSNKSASDPGLYCSDCPPQVLKSGYSSAYNVASKVSLDPHTSFVWQTWCTAVFHGRWHWHGFSERWHMDLGHIFWDRDRVGFYLGQSRSMLRVISLVCISCDVGSDMLLHFSLLVEVTASLSTRIGSCDFVICIACVGCWLLWWDKLA